MNPQDIPQKPDRVTTASLLEAIAENGVRQDYARQLIQTEVDNKQFDFEWRLARTFTDSGEFDLIKGKTPEQAIASAMAKIQMGKYWGINPADSMRFIRFDRGKPVLENEIIAAKLQEAGWEWDLEFPEDERTLRCTGCVMYPRRKNKAGHFEPLLDRNGKQVVIEFGEKEATEAMIYEKDKWIRLIDKWNFKSWAADMYYTKVIARFKRRYAPGVLVGARTMDEVGVDFDAPQTATTPEDGSPFTVTPKSETTIPVETIALPAVAQLGVADRSEFKELAARVMPSELARIMGANGEDDPENIRPESLGAILVELREIAPQSPQSPSTSQNSPSNEGQKQEVSPRTRKKAQDITTRQTATVNKEGAKPEAVAKPEASTTEPVTSGQATTAPPPANSFQATDDDLPENLRKPVPMIERLRAIQDAVCAGTGQTAEKVIGPLGTFVRAFTGLQGQLKKATAEPEFYRDVVPIMESLIARRETPLKWNGNPLTMATLLIQAHEVGLSAGTGWRSLQAVIATWDDKLKAKIVEAAIRQYPDNAVELITEGGQVLGEEEVKRIVNRAKPLQTGAGQEGLPWDK